MKKISIIILLVSALCSCRPKSAEILRLEHEADSIKEVVELEMDSIMLEYIKLGYSPDRAMQETHGGFAHRDNCEKYKKWAKGLRGE